MGTLTTFQNSNGRTYNVVATLEFNTRDKQEYSDSWQETRAMLLEDINKHEYVVAQYVGEDSWGFGGYYDNLKDATEKFNEIVREYNRK